MATYHRDLIENIKKSNMFDIYMFMTAIIFFLAYSIFIYMNLNDFILDMTYQFSRKLGRAPFFYNIKFMLLLFFSLFVMIFTYNPKQKHVFVASSFAATMILVYVNGQEMWYQVFRNIGLSILIILLIGSFNKGLLRVFIGGSLVFLLVGGTSGIAFSGMRPNLLRGDYIDESFSRSLENSLLKLRENEGRNLSVSFNITGADMMFYNFLSEHHFQLVHRMPAELVQPMPVDVCIHISRNLDPNWLHTLTINQLPDPSLCRLATILSGSNDEVAVMLNHNYSSYWHRLYSHHKN